MSEPYEMPRFVDEPKQFFLWSADEFVPMMIATFIGVVVEQLFISLCLGFAVSRLYRRFKDSRPDGYVQHIFYWWGLYTPKSRTITHPFIRLFIG